MIQLNDQLNRKYMKFPKELEFSKRDELEGKHIDKKYCIVIIIIMD